MKVFGMFIAAVGLAVITGCNKESQHLDVIRSKQLVPLRACITDIVKVDKSGIKYLVKYEGEVSLVVDLSSAEFNNEENDIKISNLCEPQAEYPNILNRERINEMGIVRTLWNRISGGPDYSKMDNEMWQQEEDRFKKTVDEITILKNIAKENAERTLKAFYEKQGKKLHIVNWKANNKNTDKMEN